MQQQQQFALLGFQFCQTISNRSATFLPNEVLRRRLLMRRPLGGKIVDGVDELQTPMTGQHPKRLVPGGRDNPPGKCPRLADAVDVLQQSEPHELVHVKEVVVQQLVSASDVTHERRETAAEVPPRQVITMRRRLRRDATETGIQGGAIGSPDNVRGSWWVFATGHARSRRSLDC